MWFDGATAGWIGGISGAILGMAGGILGTIAGICAPKGKCRVLVLSSMRVFIAVGLLSLITAGIALFDGQPYHVWYPLLMIGIAITVVGSCIYLVIKKAYTASELKKMHIADMK